MKKVLIALLVVFAMAALAGCDDSGSSSSGQDSKPLISDEAKGFRKGPDGKLQLSTNDGWVNYDQFAGHAAGDTLEDVQNIAQGAVDGINAVAEQAQRYPNQGNPTGGTCADTCSISRKVCRDRGEKFDSCRCRCY